MEMFLRFIIDMMYGTEIMNRVKDFLIIDFNAPGTMGYEAWEYVMGVNFQQVVRIAIPMLSIWFLLSITTEVLEGQYTIEKFGKMFIKFAIVLILFDKTPAILKGILELGDALVNTFELGALGNQEIEPIHEAIKTLTNDYSLISSIILFIVLFIPCCINIAIQVSIWITAISRMFELMVRFVLSPIALADSFINGLNSTGIRYIKKFFALSLQAVVIIFGVTVYMKIQTSLTPDSGMSIDLSTISSLIMYLLTNVAVTVALGAFISKTQRLAEELLGL